MNKTILNPPIKVTKEELKELWTILEISEYKDNKFVTKDKWIITTDSEWRVTEIESKGLFELSGWIDFLLTIID
mgnify:CR=1 FL=1